jgi:hypothetical protein
MQETILKIGRQYRSHPVYAHIICPWLVHKTTNVPVVYMGLVLSGFEGGLYITRGILGGRALKCPSLWIVPPQNHFVPPHINTRYINSYFCAGIGVAARYCQPARAGANPWRGVQILSGKHRT